MIMLTVFAICRLVQDFMDVDIALGILLACRYFGRVLGLPSVHLLPGTHACGPDERIDDLLYKYGSPCFVLTCLIDLVPALKRVLKHDLSLSSPLLSFGRGRISPDAPAERLKSP